MDLDQCSEKIKAKSFKSKYNAVLKIKKTGSNENINTLISEST